MDDTNNPTPMPVEPATEAPAMDAPAMPEAEPAMEVPMEAAPEGATAAEPAV